MNQQTVILRTVQLDLMPATPFPAEVYMHCTRLTFGKPFVRKQFNVLVFVISSTKNVEMLIELQEDCSARISRYVKPMATRCG